ncbi:MAG: polysaccharide deacetylase [Alphaproteobacteria bacterium]|mgnify:FL=1|jgi:peptidoglycan/xylan/chitin deacetylase (PgdA/CDA1 family)|nr:polysaccharide deacetylase [Alphaproteobacteria bacterium]PPR13267.1 MAG: Peptidoglycan deacetylase [Alphaproteobacteria bacterium MarineAlpha12_Bin1]|tara:strand:- start:7391 stop:8230 length:840 start_codon:yes stop_codon:yes gene_type:complete
MSRHIVCLTFDFDTQSGFISRGMTTPTPMSRGEFGHRVASDRIIKTLKDREILSTWFVPGFTIESHTNSCESIIREGHEIAHHSWAHIPPANQSREEEEEDLIRANEAIKKLTGYKARGYRSPSWDLSENTVDLLNNHNFLYDSSLMGADYIPYRTRVGDKFSLGNIYEYGTETNLLEIPISWSLDDHPHFEFFRTSEFLMPGLNSARTVMDSWYDEFIYMKKSVDWGVLTYTMHPYVIGRGFRMLALEDLIDRLIKEDAIFMTMESAAGEAISHLGFN